MIRPYCCRKHILESMHIEKNQIVVDQEASSLLGSFLILEGAMHTNTGGK